MRNIIIVSDFGKFYTLQMMGKILSICENVRINTIKVENYSIISAAFIIYQLSKFFNNTIFICVVDPYVGTKRKSIIIEKDKNFFIGPNNGIFSMIKSKKVIEIDEKKFNASKTFHGRDIFAVIAGKILNGENIENFGKKKTKIKKINLKNKILYIDNFGNIITGIKKINAKYKDKLRIKINEKEINAIYVKTFSDEKENFIVYKGSSGFLEIGKFMDNAAKILNVNIGDKVKIYKE